MGEQVSGAMLGTTPHHARYHPSTLGTNPSYARDHPLYPGEGSTDYGRIGLGVWQGCSDTTVPIAKIVDVDRRRRAAPIHVGNSGG